MKDVRIQRKGAQRIQDGHPWVYRSDLLGATDLVPGEVVRVLDGRNVRLGWAHASTASTIALRMLPYETQLTDQGFFRRLIKRAQTYRDLVVSDTDSYRLVHAEADLLPGLIIDRYRDFFSIQTLTQGMDVAKSAVVAALEELYQPRGIYERNDTGSRGHEGLEQVTGPLAGEEPDALEITMNGVTFALDLPGGQKTGFFLDQRENYRAAAEYARGAALDAFCYQGGFALHLAKKCDSVEAVDSSEAALAAVRSNVHRNGVENVRTKQAKVFDLLSDYERGKKIFQTIVLDPPAFAKSRKHVESAGRAYKEINLKALKLLDKDGFLVTSSCSHHFSEADLLSVVAEAALDAGKRLRVVERRTQARDHPIVLTIPETHYLKCLILQSY
jgi:23S rRNA (cytosine1962-C5)-methyltransferase